MHKRLPHAVLKNNPIDSFFKTCLLIIYLFIFSIAQKNSVASGIWTQIFGVEG